MICFWPFKLCKISNDIGGAEVFEMTRIMALVMTTYLVAPEVASAQAVNDNGILEARIERLLGPDWTISGDFRGDSQTAFLYSDVVLANDAFAVTANGLSAALSGDRMIGESIEVYTENGRDALFQAETLRLSGEDFGTVSFNEVTCEGLGLGQTRQELNIVMQNVLARPDSRLRFGPAAVMGTVTARQASVDISVSQESSGCMMRLAKSLEDVRVTSGQDSLSVERLDISSSLPTGETQTRGSLKFNLQDMILVGFGETYSVETMTFETVLPRPVIAAYLPWIYEDDEREVRFREILFQDGADVSLMLKGVDLDLAKFFPGDIAKSHMRGGLSANGRLRETTLTGNFDFDFPQTFEMSGDIDLEFSENPMTVSDLQIPFISQLRKGEFQFVPGSLLEDMTRITGMRASETIPEILRDRLADLPLIGGSYNSEIDQIEAWLEAIEAGATGYLEFRPDAPVNLGMIAGLFVVDVPRALRMLGYRFQPEIMH